MLTRHDGKALTTRGAQLTSASPTRSKRLISAVGGLIVDSLLMFSSGHTPLLAQPEPRQAMGGGVQAAVEIAQA